LQQGSTKAIIVKEKKGENQKNLEPRGDIMVLFKRVRTKWRFLDFLKEHKVLVFQGELVCPGL
jgi:hypothetical protein